VELVDVDANKSITTVSEVMELNCGNNLDSIAASKVTNPENKKKINE
jgi:hypothetical protein